MNPYEVLIRPIFTEKSTALAEKNNQYVFEVNKKTNKNQIKRAVEEMYKVNVTKVVTMINHGKRRRLGMHEGMKPDWKKAIVTLKEGQRIEFEEKVL